MEVLKTTEEDSKKRSLTMTLQRVIAEEKRKWNMLSNTEFGYTPCIHDVLKSDFMDTPFTCKFDETTFTCRFDERDICITLITIMCLYVSHVDTCCGKNPAGNHKFKVNNWNTGTRCEICSKLTIKTLEWRQWYRSGVLIVKFEHILYHVLLFLLLT